MSESELPPSESDGGFDRWPLEGSDGPRSTGTRAEAEVVGLMSCCGSGCRFRCEVWSVSAISRAGSEDMVGARDAEWL